MDLIFQYLSLILAFKVRALLSHRSWSSMCCVPRVEFLDYPGCECLRTMSKDELKSTFCERPSDWGERQFTYCLDFAKGPQFLNMVMTFVFHPLSHYNSIIEPCARFFFPFLKILSLVFLLTLFCLS